MYLLPLVVLLVFTLLLLFIRKKVPTTSTLPPELTPTSIPTEEIFQSPWATDSGVLEIEEKISSIEEKLETVDLQEVKLQPPILDMDVSL
jgi:hypothetical protein